MLFKWVVHNFCYFSKFPNLHFTNYKNASLIIMRIKFWSFAIYLQITNLISDTTSSLLGNWRNQWWKFCTNIMFHTAAIKIHVNIWKFISLAKSNDTGNAIKLIFWQLKISNINIKNRYCKCDSKLIHTENWLENRYILRI